MTTRRATGLIFDQPHQKPKTLYRATPGFKLSDLVPWDLSSFCPPPPDQGKLGQCTGVSFVGSCKTYDNANGQPSALGSCLAAYWGGRFEDWLASGGGAGLSGDQLVQAFIAQDTDCGSSHASVCLGVSQLGLPPASAWQGSYDDTGSPQDQFRMRPDAEAQRLGWDTRSELVRLGLDDEDTDAKIVDLNHAGMNKQPIDIGQIVDEQFCSEEFDPNVAYAPDVTKPAGGHALYLVAMRINPQTGEREYKEAMSWGPGAYAFIWVPEKTVVAPSTQLTIIKRAPVLVEAAA
jgi:hypothetical protein